MIHDHHGGEHGSREARGGAIIESLYQLGSQAGAREE